MNPLPEQFARSRETAFPIVDADQLQTVRPVESEPSHSMSANPGRMNTALDEVRYGLAGVIYSIWSVVGKEDLDDSRDAFFLRTACDKVFRFCAWFHDFTRHASRWRVDDLANGFLAHRIS